jgi:hypothetical protein
MSSRRSKDRASLCLFTFTDGRRCRTPRSGSHPHFCFYHARKESQAKVAEKLGRDLSFFFSGEYLSACDLSAALGRLLAAVARGDIKPRTATTLAYLAQTLVQTLHLAQNEYINAFGASGWREAVRKSVDLNDAYLHPRPTPPGQSPAPSATQPTAPPAPSPVHPPTPPQPQAQAQAKPLPQVEPPLQAPSQSQPPATATPSDPAHSDQAAPNSPAQTDPTNPQSSPNLPTNRTPFEFITTGRFRHRRRAFL